MAYLVIVFGFRLRLGLRIYSRSIIHNNHGVEYNHELNIYAPCVCIPQNITIVQTLATQLQHGPAKNKHLFGVSHILFFVGLTPGRFLYPVSYPPKVSNRGLCRYTSNEDFLIGGYCEWVCPPASNAPRCGVLAAEIKTAASSHEQLLTT